MHTQINAYERKLSSGIILALLALSGTLVLLPAIASVHATANNPTIQMWPSQLQTGGGGFGRCGGCNGDILLHMNFTNPASNTVSIVRFTVNAPSGFSAYDCATFVLMDTSNCNGQTISWAGDDLVDQVPPGSTDQLAGGFSVPTPSSYPASYTLTSSWLDSNGVSHPGPSLSVMLFDPSESVVLTDTLGGSYTAGGAPDSLTTDIGVHNAGVVVTWADPSGLGSFSGSGATCIHSWLCYSKTGSDGKSTVTFQPSNTVGASSTVYATIGRNAPFCPDSTWSSTARCNGQYVDGATKTVSTTTPAAPSKVEFKLDSVDFPQTATHYEFNHNVPPNGGSGNDMAEVVATRLSVSVTDRFGNAIPFGSISNITVTATSAGGVFDNTGSNATTISCHTLSPPEVDCTTGVINVNYYQSGTFGSTGILTATATGSFPAVSGTSGGIITTTFITSVASAPTCADCGSNLAAGSSETVKFTLATTQKGVPVIFFAVNTTDPYFGSWIGGSNPYCFVDSTNCPTLRTGELTNIGYNITGTTGSTGKASEKFTIDTTAGSMVHFYVDVAKPVDGASDTVLDGSASPSGSITTVAGVAAGFVVQTFFDKVLAEPTTTSFTNTQLYVDVTLVDAFGNTAVNSAATTIQVNLAASAGVLSATTIYIASGSSDTATPPSFGPVTWQTAGTAPTTITLTASGNVNGHAATNPERIETLTIATHTPSLTAKATTGHTFASVTYSNIAAVTFSGKAKVSKGYNYSDPSFPDFVSHNAGVWYKIDSGSWISAATGTSPLSWTSTISIANGLHTVTFMANDSNGFNSALVAISVLVDTSAPTISFTTAANANLSGGQSVLAKIVDTEGDLNATSVTATGNSTTALTVAISGANNLGHSVTYNVTISGMTTGTWNIVLSATDLAGNTASKSITVHVVVPFALSFVIQGSPSYTTIGGFNGISATYTNEGSASQSVVVFAIWKNGLGQTVAVTAGSMTLAAGATGTAFAPLVTGLPSGTYTVNVFVWTTDNLSVSSTTTISVTV